MPLTIATLRQIPVFEALKDAHLQSLAALFEPHALGEGEVLFRAGEPADAFYVLTGGELSLLEEGSVRFRLSPVAVVGELGGMTALARNTTAVAAAPCELWRAARARVLASFQESPAVGVAFYESLLRIVAEKARRDQLRLEDMREHIIRTQKAMKQMRELVLESPDSPVSEVLHGVLEKQIRSNRRVNYRVEPSGLLPADVHLDDGTDAAIEEISRRQVALRFPGEAPARGSAWSGVLRLAGGVEFPISGTVTSAAGGRVEIELDGMIDEYVQALEVYLTRVQMLEFVV